MKKQPRRKNIRLDGYDYRRSAYYFVTICTHQRQWYFEEENLKIVVEIVLNKISNWQNFKHVKIDAFVIMPNHIHVIFAFIDPTHATADFEVRAIRLSKSLGSLIATFKGEVTNRVRKMKRDPDYKIWQRGYYDRIIRNEAEHNHIREYIRLNPEKWQEDSEHVGKNLDRMLAKMEYHLG